VRKQRALRREARNAVPLGTIALVGYTNAGKSTLFNALSSAEVLVSSRMFATLDPTIRAIRLPSHRRVLVSDTVGFIRDLPKGLLTAFRATLEEVQEAALIVHVSDVSNPHHAELDAEVCKILDELGVSGRPVLRVLNKIDRLTPEERQTLSHEDAAEQEENGKPRSSTRNSPASRSAASRSAKHDASEHDASENDASRNGASRDDGSQDRSSPNAAQRVATDNPTVLVSAMTGEGIDELLRRIDQAMPIDPTVAVSLRMPLSEGRKLALIHAMGKVLRSEVDDSHMFLDAEVPESIVRRLRLKDYNFAGTFPAAVA
jgi:GTPase